MERKSGSKHRCLLNDFFLKRRHYEIKQKKTRSAEIILVHKLSKSVSCIMVSENKQTMARHKRKGQARSCK